MRIELADDAEIISKEWLNEWADRKQLCWNLPGTDLFIARSRNHLKCDLWVILQEEPDGTETALCDARNRGDIREFLEAIGAAADGVELVNYE